MIQPHPSPTHIHIHNFTVGQGLPLFLMAGPCVVESRSLALESAHMIQEIAQDLGLNVIYKSSYDKANRSSHTSFRGLGIDKGLEILEDVKNDLNIPIVTDVHSIDEITQAAQVADVLQTPAFLCRQSDFIEACARTNRPVNFKKGQFLAPEDMQHVLEKARHAAQTAGLPDQFMLCERGSSFGYHNLVVDMRGLAIMRQTGAPIIFDATHSVQLPGGSGKSSGGQREFVPVLARAAAAAGIDGLFLETHPNPDIAQSDAPNLVPIKHLRALLEMVLDVNACVKKHAFLEYRMTQW